MIISKITPKNRRHFPETKTSATGRMGEGLIEAMGGDIHALVLSPMNSGDDGWFRRWYFDYDNQTCERNETEIGLPEVQVGDDEMASFLVADADRLSTTIPSILQDGHRDGAQFLDFHSGNPDHGLQYRMLQ